MIKHYIIMSSAYSIGKRIAIDFCYEEDGMDKIKKVVNKIIKECGMDIPLSTHFIQTNSKDWNSVVELDYFFKNVELLNNENDFIKLILKDRKLNGVDIAKYILSRYKCTHLKLEKLVYLCYADYLCSHHEKLFIDNIFSYKYGPVVESVYSKYKNYGYDTIETEYMYSLEKIESPIKSRIMASENGVEKLMSIDKTLEKYGPKSAQELVNLTHRTSSPWNMAGSGKQVNKKITDDIILKYHNVEIL